MSTSRVILCLSILMLSATAYCQSSTQSKKDSCYCVPVKIFDKMVNEVLLGRACDSLSRSQGNELIRAGKVIAEQDSTNTALLGALKASQSSDSTCTRRYENQKDLTEVAEKETRNVKKERWIERAAAVLIIIILL